jgi:hypothetical protein
MDRVACTIVARNYLGFARILAGSFLEHHPGGKFVTLVVDADAADSMAGDMPGELMAGRDLGISGFEGMAFRYQVLELSTAVKPFLLERLLRKSDRVLYLDPDIVVFRPLDALYKRLARVPVLLTPHVVEPIDDQEIPGEQTILTSGIFNLGFIGVARGEVTARFLGWWGSRLRRDCRLDAAHGVFVDQRWVDLAHALFPGFECVREPEYNVAGISCTARLAGTTADGP